DVLDVDPLDPGGLEIAEGRFDLVERTDVAVLGRQSVPARLCPLPQGPQSNEPAVGVGGGSPRRYEGHDRQGDVGGVPAGPHAGFVDALPEDGGLLPGQDPGVVLVGESRRHPERARTSPPREDQAWVRLLQWPRKRQLTFQSETWSSEVELLAVPRP